MTNKYEITVERIKGSGVEYSLTHFKHDDGHFVSNAPTTPEELEKVKIIKDIARKFNESKLAVGLDSHP
jgi:hypothetical protein